MGAQAVRLSNVDINNALENKDFEVLFQPIFDLSNGALARMETFVRWRHPSLGVLPPGAFISFFESQGRMSELTRYILDVALDGYQSWRGPFAPGFSINLAYSDLEDDAFAAHLDSTLKGAAFPADLVTLECPMPPVDSDYDALIKSIERLRSTGARLAIEVRGRADDFLRTIDPFPFDEIKTGGSSILRFARTVRGPGLSAISDLLDIANKANAVTTAVGVEDQASLSALRGLGFAAAQGNHLGNVGALTDFRPARVNDVRELLDLPALSSKELSALFRTTAPDPKSSDEQDEDDANSGVVDRLQERVAQSEPASEPSQEPPAATPATTPAPGENAEAAIDENAAAAASPLDGKSDADRQALLERARKKKRAIALAKRAKARNARKAAAIERAKAKAASGRPPELPETPASEDGPLAVEPPPEVAAPRAFQDRIEKEFAAAASGAEPADDARSEVDVDFSLDEPPSEPQRGAPPPEPVAAPQRVTALTTELGAPDEMQLKLPIGRARAYFRPGLSVSGAPPALDDDSVAAVFGRAQPSARKTSPEPVSPAAAPPIHDDARISAPHAAETSAPPRPVSREADQSDADAVVADLAQGTLFEDEKRGEPTVRKPRPAGSQSFLTRRYRLWPTHFWPKSWKRAWRRRQSARTDEMHAPT